MKETIEAFKNAYITLGLNYFTLFFLFPSYFWFFKLGKNFRDFWKKFIFRENNFREFLV